MASKIAAIKEDYYPSTNDEASDITDGGMTTYASHGYDVVDPKHHRFRIFTWEHSNNRSELSTDKTTWHSNFGGIGLRLTGNEDPNNIFNDNKLTAYWTLFSAPPSNFCYEIGLQVGENENSNNFDVSSNNVQMLSHVKGVSFQWETGGSNQKYGRNPYPEKVGLVYSTKADASTSEDSSKIIIPCTLTKAGDELKQYNDREPVQRNTTVTVTFNSEDWAGISSMGLIHVGYVFQFWCPPDSILGDSQTISIWNLRPVVCSGERWGSSSHEGSSQLINLRGTASLYDYSFGRVGFAK